MLSGGKKGIIRLKWIKIYKPQLPRLETTLCQSDWFLVDHVVWHNNPFVNKTIHTVIVYISGEQLYPITCETNSLVRDF